MKLKKQMKQACLAATAFAALASGPVWGNQPDSLYLYTYGTDLKKSHNGLRYAWGSDGNHWKRLDVSFVHSDYGTWSAEKRMLWPFLMRDNDGVFHALWSVNERDGVFAYAHSKDLINWKPQDYPVVMPQGGNCLQPEVSYDSSKGEFLITWLSVHAGDTLIYGCTTTDFLKFSDSRKMTETQRLNTRRSIGAVAADASGTVLKVPSEFVRTLENATYARQYKDKLHGENAKSDTERFGKLQSVTATLTLDTLNSKTISPLLMGIFFEDISRAADGGLYAELIQNRDFEYIKGGNRDQNWGPSYSWSVKGQNMSFDIATDNPIHPNNPHYAILTVEQPGASFVNEGFGRIPLKKGGKYNLSLFAKQLSGKKGKFQVSLVGTEGQIYATTSISAPASEWKKQKAVLVSKEDASDAMLEIKPLAKGTVALDMISLFPQHTFKGRENGLRADLAQVIADLNPQFVRFPGGCVAHGNGLDNMYRWRNTVGPLEARKPQRNIWGYHQTAGLGYYEYFQFCEDLGAVPVPVLPAAVPCQNSSLGGAGQQGGIPMDQMGEYIQEVLDLIEWANGDAKTTKWGKIRAQAGHPKPFNLKYLGIGNEDLISEVFKARFDLIYKAVKEKHPEIIVIGTVGPFYEGSDYTEGWNFATELGVPMVDEHYYESPGWFIQNQDFYDFYDRKKPHVYLGEYASRGNTLYNALAEAAFLCGLERNGDVVEMTSYAPLLAKEGQTNWNPDLIYFNNTEIKPTPNYYVQQLFGQHNGANYLAARLDVSDKNEEVVKRVASSVVRADNGDLIVKLVNILPTPVDMRLNLPGVQKMQSEAEKIVLAGNAESRQATPVTSRVQINEDFRVDLPAYSLTVIRIKK